MNPTLLRIIYKKYKIKKKKFRWFKEIESQDLAKQATELAKAKWEIARAKRDGFRIIYIDETMFTRKTLSDLEWSNSKDNMRVALKRLDEPTLALLAGIS